MRLITHSTTRDPVLGDVFGLSNRLSQLLHAGVGDLDSQLRDGTSPSWVPPVDIFEEADGIRIVAEIPGVKPDEVKISLENNVLTIHGAKQPVPERRAEQVHRYERVYGAFARSFTLPTTVDTNTIKASYEHGVLTVTLPKAEQAKPRQIAVDVASK